MSSAKPLPILFCGRFENVPPIGSAVSAAGASRSDQNPEDRAADRAATGTGCRPPKDAESGQSDGHQFRTKRVCSHAISPGGHLQLNKHAIDFPSDKASSVPRWT
jgi:hypothetical protein